MRGIETGKVRIRHEVFTEIARLAYEGDDYAKRLEELPFKIIPGEIGTYRDSLFLERAVVGERLRLALARELLRDSDIIIFDESTANLDPVHEQQLLDVIDRHFSTKTILLISHRESSIARFSRRIYLEKLRERS